jgi:hypothetical protein
MRHELLARLPETPPSEVEWEDLLFRLELMLRALRVVLEDAPGAPRPSGVDEILEEMVRRERFVGDFLERAAAPVEAEKGAAARSDPTGEDPVQLFLRLRARNFAMVQRRGIEVWKWSGWAEDDGRATVYQVLSQLAAGDVAALAELRGHARKGGDPC